MEGGVAKTVLRDAIERGSRDDTAEGRWSGKTNIIGEYQQDIRRILRRHDLRRPRGFAVNGVRHDRAGERRCGQWQDAAVGKLYR
jgi:hypothetical protein